MKSLTLQEINPVIRAALPGSLSCSILEIGRHSVHDLREAEKILISPRANEKRIKEFVAGRMAARTALEELGLTIVPGVGRGSKNEPLWPRGICGSITHSDQFSIALTGFLRTYAGIGCDLEHIEKELEADLVNRIALPAEEAWINSDPEQYQLRAYALFSAKEALYKAVFPIHQTFFGFAGASLIPSATEQGFEFGVNLTYDNAPKALEPRTTLKTIVVGQYVFSVCLIEE